MRADLAGGALWLAAGAWIAWEGWDLGLGAPHDPGSGFVLFWAGLLLAALALVQLAVAARGSAGADAPPVRQDGNWRKPLVAVIVLTGYAVALLPLGFLIATAGFLLVLLLAIEPTRLSFAVLLAAGASVAVWGLFDRLLGVGLPRGPLGF